MKIAAAIFACAAVEIGMAVLERPSFVSPPRIHLGQPHPSDYNSLYTHLHSMRRRKFVRPRI